MLRQGALTSVRGRTHGVVGTWLKDGECVQMAAACAFRDAGDLLDFLFPRHVAKIASANAPSLAITADEWCALFGADAQPAAPIQMEPLSRDASFRTNVANLCNALRCTVTEQSQQRCWSRLWTQAACLVAMHVDTHEESLAMCLGNVVRADSRRLEELRTTIDDTGVDCMLLGQTLHALACSV